MCDLWLAWPGVLYYRWGKMLWRTTWWKISLQSPASLLNLKNIDSLWRMTFGIPHKALLETFICTSVMWMHRSMLMHLWCAWLSVIPLHVFGTATIVRSVAPDASWGIKLTDCVAIDFIQRVHVFFILGLLTIGCTGLTDHNWKLSMVNY